MCFVYISKFRCHCFRPKSEQEITKFTCNSGLVGFIKETSEYAVRTIQVNSTERLLKCMIIF